MLYRRVQCYRFVGLPALSIDEAESRTLPGLRRGTVRSLYGNVYPRYTVHGGIVKGSTFMFGSAAEGYCPGRAGQVGMPQRLTEI